MCSDIADAVPIFESVISIDLLNSLIENTGGDNKELILKRVNEIKSDRMQQQIALMLRHKQSVS